ncbi:DUF6002 family protein [Kitasatospora kifunensis]|uniref:Uncharacterized protein n=1 Tax=Kitasatospora kifunensis TaxID=58351 RepID=A0A7W7QZJ4_KITKI|nr:DUF6002 family protein [Kitasatospora kifunensis]MBB4922433.1 hypothetical protein [Kitasatospora kifunensis]
MPPSTDAPIVVDSALTRYGAEIRRALSELAPPVGEFGPGNELPPDSEKLSRYFAASSLAFADLGSYRGKRIRLLDLMRNPRTRTTKTFASLPIVARAVEHIRRTGERVMLLSPSSGNKATALRDAVLRAHESELATAEQLSITVVVPGASRDKLWSSPLAEDELLHSRNPVAVYDGAERADVKPLARALVDGYGETLRERCGVNLWYTLDINNYKAADIVRAFAERDFLPPAEGRLHVHAVSSAYGLLGHDLGARRLAAAGLGKPSAHYFLVQHLDTPDMVLSLYFGSHSRENLPTYHYDEQTGLHHQDSDPHFPATAYEVGENLDPTFYTRTPPTSAEINPIIDSRGGGGIVVSLAECLERYPRLRAMLAPARIVLPADPRELREWSIVMAMTGLLNGIDRGLVPEDDILVHGSGSYHQGDFTPLAADRLTPVADVAELAEVALAAAEGKAR